jgi:hypothetical protein
LRNSSADFEEKVKQCREHITKLAATKLAADTRKPAVSSGGAQGSNGSATHSASFLRDMATKLAFNAVASPTEAGAAQGKRHQPPMSQTAPAPDRRYAPTSTPLR